MKSETQGVPDYREKTEKKNKEKKLEWRQHDDISVILQSIKRRNVSSSEVIICNVLKSFYLPEKIWKQLVTRCMVRIYGESGDYQSYFVAQKLKI